MINYPLFVQPFLKVPGISIRNWLGEFEYGC
jgi:hypothetical protein